MEKLLIVDAVLLALALMQAFLGILFFRPKAAVIYFFFQSLCVFASAVMAIGFTFQHHLLCGWCCLVLFVLLFLFGFRSWRKKPEVIVKEP